MELDDRSKDFRLRKVSQVVADHIKQMIIDGELAEGDSLPPEGQLISQYEVSRATVREAIRILEAEGLVTTSRGGPKGAKVHYPSVDVVAQQAGLAMKLRGATAREVIHLLAVIGPAAARDVAEQRPQPDFAPLHCLLSVMEEAIASQPRRFTHAVHRFDRWIYEHCENRALSLTGQAMSFISEADTASYPSSYRNLPRGYRDTMKASLELMRETVSQLEAGDGDGAEALTRKRFIRTEAVYLRRTEQQRRVKTRQS